MRTPGALLKFVAKAVGNALGAGVAGDFIVDVLPAIAKDVWGWWTKDRQLEERRDELEAIAQAGGEEIRRQAAEIVKEVVADKPPEIRQAVEKYLVQMPATIRSSLRRPSDPTGTSVSTELVPQNPNDLLKFLPRKISPFKPGDRPLVGVDWELEQLLGVGGFGEVWKARNPHFSSVAPVALKFCLDPSAAAMLRNEAGVLDRVMRQGKHPGMVQLLRTYLSAEVPCLEYEFVEGGELTGLIHQWHLKKGRWQIQQAARIIQQLAQIVGFAHQLKPPIVHRDLKPANILLQRGKDGKLQIKVADFGIGGVASNQAVVEATRGTSPGKLAVSIVLGTHSPLYASPQQIRGMAPDPRDDIFALGVIWHQLLTGDLGSGRPGGTRWYRRLAEDGMPQRLVDILARCFEEHAKDRMGNANELADQLASAFEAPPAAILVGEPTSTSAEGHATRAQLILEKGDFDGAIIEATNAIQLNPQFPRMHCLRAEAFLQKHEYDKAISDASEGLRLSPKLAYAYFLRAEAYRKQRRFTEANADLDNVIAQANELIKVNPSGVSVYSTRALAYFMRCEFDLAIADATEALRLDPGNKRAFCIRALAHNSSGEWVKAIVDANEVIKLDGSCALPFEERARANYYKNNPIAAIADATHAINLNPKSANAYNIRSGAYLRQKLNAEALADATAAVRLEAEGEDKWNAKRPLWLFDPPVQS